MRPKPSLPPQGSISSQCLPGEGTIFSSGAATDKFPILQEVTSHPVEGYSKRERGE